MPTPEDERQKSMQKRWDRINQEFEHMESVGKQDPQARQEFYSKEELKRQKERERLFYATDIDAPNAEEVFKQLEDELGITAENEQE